MKTPFHLLFLLAVLLTPPAAPASTQPAEYAGMLEGHNSLRATLNLPPLRWSDTAARQAQSWADALAAQGCPLRYNPDERRRELYGENILKAWAQDAYPGWRRSVPEVLQRWQEEGRYYDHASHTCRAPAGKQCGQYLQMIWETTEVLGCGRARCETSEIWVCNYTPRGGQEGLKPYGNPPPAPPPEVAVGPLECSIQLGDGADLKPEDR